MKITFLGTGTSQGVPVIGCNCSVCRSIDFRDKRLRTSLMVSEGDTNIVIDTGPDFRQQMLRENVQSLTAVVFTHEHKDHTAGMDDVRAFNFKQKMDMPIYARKTVLEQLKREFSYIFSGNNYPGIPKIEINEINGLPFRIADLLIEPIEVMHYKLPVYGFKIGMFTYITDANYISEDTYDKISDTEILVINALQKEKHISHFTLTEALSEIEKIKPKKSFLVHMSHKLGRHSDIQKDLPENVFLAYDGLTLTF